VKAQRPIPCASCLQASVINQGGIDMAELGATARGHCPRYRMKVCPNENKAEEWMNTMAAEGYRFVSMEAVTSTQHFSKELESVVWIVMEMREDNRDAQA